MYWCWVGIGDCESDLGLQRVGKPVITSEGDERIVGLGDEGDTIPAVDRREMLNLVEIEHRVLREETAEMGST